MTVQSYSSLLSLCLLVVLDISVWQNEGDDLRLFGSSWRACFDSGMCLAVVCLPLHTEYMSTGREM